MRRSGRSWRFPAITLAALALALTAAAPADGAFPGRNGRLAVGIPSPTAQGYNQDVWTLEPDGSGTRRITTDPGAEEEPAWSPNGRWIAFVHSDTVCCALAAGDIWIARADGTDQRRITDGPAYDTSPAWSPDGSKIVFAGTREAPSPGVDPDYDLYVVNADGTGRRLLVSGERRSELDPAWSPDGTRIAFATDIYRPDGRPHPEVRLGLRTVAADGTDERVVVPPGELAYDPDWSPDGSSLAYTNGSDIFTVPAGGGTSTRFPRGSYTGSRTDPAWSPDAKRIAFSGFLFGHMALDGSTNTLLLCCARGSSWQPLGPSRPDYRNGPAFCRADRAFLGEAEFRVSYGANANETNAFGKCVSANG